MGYLPRYNCVGQCWWDMLPASSVMEGVFCLKNKPGVAGLHAGTLRPVLADLHSAGKTLGLPFLAHADLQPAACLLMLLEAFPVKEPCEGIPSRMTLTSWRSSAGLITKGYWERAAAEGCSLVSLL